MLDFSQFEYLTFDCYGTLINWEAGIVGALRPVLSAHGIEISDEDAEQINSIADLIRYLRRRRSDDAD